MLGSEDLSKYNSTASLSRSNYNSFIRASESIFKHPAPMDTKREAEVQAEEPVEARQSRDHSGDPEELRPLGRAARLSSPGFGVDFGLKDGWMENRQGGGIPKDSPADSTDIEAMTDVDNHSLASVRPPESIRLQPQVVLRGNQIAYAKSQAAGFEPPLPPRKERLVVQDLLAQIGLSEASGSRHQVIDSSTNRASLSSSCGEQELEFIEFELTDFTVYLPENRSHPFEMRGLNHLATRIAHSTFLFDGILSVDGSRDYVQGIPFKICSIGNYGEENHEVGSHIWIQSDFNAGSDIYYRLVKPSPEYRRFHDCFIWLANLAKHFVDYCQVSGNDVSVWDFRSKFSRWMKQTHDGSVEFRSWYQKFGKDDFRVAIAMNIAFLYKEAIGVNESLISLPIWAVLFEKDAVPRQEIKEDMTVVTPYIYECFKELRFGHLLKVVEAARFTDARHDLQGEKLHLTGNTDLPDPEFHAASRSFPLSGAKTINRDPGLEAQRKEDATARRRKKIAAIKRGDVLSVTKDSEGSLWKDEASRWKAADECWYIYVQEVHVSRDGDRSFDAIWLYEPSHTSCAKMKYPFSDELFLSDNCTCSGYRIEEERVLDVVEVTWHGSPSSSSRHFFVRQTYLENERFVTLKDEHKTCQHLRSAMGDSNPKLQYTIGQTVLAPPGYKTKHALEVFEIVDFVSDPSESRSFVILRHLKRRFEIDGKGRPNELVYTTRKDKLDINKIEGPCIVRFYSEADVINGLPAPYCRDGTGNAFYITSKLIETSGNSVLEAIDEHIPKGFVQGFDPLSSAGRRKLRGLDLYCGGGNFGRGLEEGGAVRNEWAVDIDRQAIHTYYANLKGPNSCKLFWGSVNDMLIQALKGNPKASDLIPLPGDVEFISAGSPCQGFSQINTLKHNDKGLKNQSLVASVASYIDFYRPSYGLLENVLGMAQKGKGRDEDVLSQLICSIVGMGYQVQIFVLDAWSFGSAQSRSRLFVSFSAPGLEPPPHPRLSHAHHCNIPTRTLGKLANGQCFGHRTTGPTPFGFPTAGQATSDLPAIGDGATQHCTSHPDHVVPLGQSQELRSQMLLIPKHPRGMNLARAWNEGQGVVTTADRQKYFGHLMYNSEGQTRESFTPISKAYGRINPNSYFSTVLSSIKPHDARLGFNIHWDEDRLMTILEAKRAQGYPDCEVLVGLKRECWKILGNSVARTVALALGLSLREAWLKSDIETLFPPAASRIVAIKKVTVSNDYRNQQVSIIRTPQKVEKSHHRSDFKDLLVPVNDGKDLSLPTRLIELEPDQPTTRKKKCIAPFKERPSKPLKCLIGLSDSDPSHSSTPRLARSRSRSERHQNGGFAEPIKGNLSTLSDSLPSVLLSKRPRKGTQPSASYSAQRRLEVLDSTASSDEEAEEYRDAITEEKSCRLLNSSETQIPAKATPTQLPKSHFETDSNSSLKRPSPMQHEGRTRLLEKRLKPSTSEPWSATSYRQPSAMSSRNSMSTMPKKLVRPHAQLPTTMASNPRRGIADHFAQRTKAVKFTECSTNSGKFHQINTNTQEQNTLQFRNSHNGASFAERTNTSIASLLSPISPRQAARIESRIIHTPRTGICRAPSTASRAKGLAVVVDLITDGEDSSGLGNRNRKPFQAQTIPPDQTVNLLTDGEDELLGPAVAGYGKWRDSKEGKEELRRRREHDEAKREYEQQQQRNRRYQPSLFLQNSQQQWPTRQ